MGWTVVLEDENSNKLVEISSEFSLQDYGNTRYKLLRYLDPYGDTIFNHLQMYDLIIDLNNIKEVDGNPLIDEVLNLAHDCKNGVHTYLVFYGD